MKKFLAALFSVLICSTVAMFAACKGCNNNEEQKKPEKLKDGIALVLTVGGSQNVDLSEYISIEGTEYVYAVSSSNDGVVTATLNENTATVTAVSKGTATVTASADEVSVSFTVTVNEKQQQQPVEKPAPEFSDVNIAYDLKDVDSKSVTLTPKTGSNTFSYTFALKEQDSKVTIVGNKLTVSYDETVEKQLTVVATYTDRENASAGSKTVDIKLSIKVTDTREPVDTTAKYKVVNGSFDNGLEGWTMVGEIGEISEQGKFWASETFEGYPVYNVGKYFAGNEPNKGTLTSSTFEVGGVNKISFKLGAAGNSECYITLEKADGTLLEIWRNTKFCDLPAGTTPEEGLPMIGNTVFACNLVTYVADLTAYAGETLKIVLHDNAISGFGFFNFDELVTYYASEDEVPAGEAAVNQLADKTALKAALDNALTAQGDYSDESYNAYVEKVEAAKAIFDKVHATQAEVDSAKTAIETAFAGLVIIVPEEVDGAEKTLVIVIGKSKEITISDYVDAKNLSGITYEISSGNALVTAGEIENGKFTVTAGATEEDVDVTVTINTKYKGESKLTVTLTIQVKCELQPTVKKQSVTQSVDIYALENKIGITIDFTQNIESNGVENLVYTVTLEDDAVTLDSNNCLTYNFNGTYSETVTEVVFNVSVSYGENKSVNYTYTLKISDTTSYRVVNGGFDNNLDGWTLDGEMGEISEQNTFWAEEFPIFNDGKYFAGSDPNTGTLTSSSFKVGGINKITFMLGAAGNDECYVTLEKADGTVLAIWRNTKFEDVGEWSMEEIGKTQFACNLVTYVADLTAYAGETLKIVLRDNATSGFGFFNFDELVTYYALEADLPENAFEAVNQLANKTELQAAVDGATAQGDYTLESYNAYTAKVEAAQAILEKVSATQAEVDSAKSAIEEAYEALELRVPAEKTGAVKSFRLLAEGSRELTISDYVDDKELSSLTYEVASADAKVTVSAISSGKFTVTAGSEEVTGATVSIVVKYDGKTVLTVEITVSVTNETAPKLNEEAVEENIDLFDEDNTESKTLDFASNVENLGELDLTYTVTMNGTDITSDLDEDNCYTYTYGSYTDTATEVVFAVKVSYTHNGNSEELNYTYTLNIKDTRAYRITNGGFDEGLNGWTLSNPNLGGVNNTETYWGSIPFNNDGNFFNAYYFNGEAKETAKGTLTSSPFTIGGSGFISYKLGGAKNADKVFLDIVEKDTGNILARYYNNAFSDDVNSTTVRGCTLVAYKADLHEHIGKTVYIRICDNAVSDYGLFFVDSFVTYYPAAPETCATATAVSHPATIYDIYNGEFNNGLDGWALSNPDLGNVNNAEAYWKNDDNPNGIPFNNDGNFFNAYAVDVESAKGTLTSSPFTIGGSGWITYKLGGAKNIETVTLEIVSVADETKRAILPNFDWSDDINNMQVRGCTLVAYKANLLKYGFSLGESVYILLTDNAENDYGLFFLDSVVTYYTEEPDGNFNLVAPTRLFNGGFETGNLTGWTMECTTENKLGVVAKTEPTADDWYQTNDGTKEGDYLFTFHYHEGENGEICKNLEDGMGTIRSSVFILEKNGIISFRLGAAHNENVYINVRTTDGVILATFCNNAYTQDTVMVQYYYQFDNSEEISCYFEIVDNATSDYGCIVMDDFRVNLESAPEGAVLGSEQTKAEREAG